MASVKNILLSSLLGGVSGGSGQYLAEKQNQREYALKKLAAEQPPSDIRSLQSIYPDWGLDPTNDQKRYNQTKALGSGLNVGLDPSGNITKEPVSRPETPTLEKNIQAEMRLYMKTHPNATQDEARSAANKKLKEKPSSLSNLIGD